MATDAPSTAPLARKLGIKAGQAIALLDAPAGWTVPDLPAAVIVRHQARGHLDLVIAFVRSHADLERRAPPLATRLGDQATLWLAWPRRAGGHVSDVTEGLLREVLLPTGLVDVKVAALDDDWSGLKFVRRRELRSRPRAPLSR